MNRPRDLPSASTRRIVAFCSALVPVLAHPHEVEAQQVPVQVRESPVRDEVRAELQRIETQARRCSSGVASFVARLSIDASGVVDSAAVFASSALSQERARGDMGFVRAFAPGQKAGRNLTRAESACVLRELRSFRVTAFSRPRFVIVSIMEIRHTSPTPW